MSRHTHWLITAALALLLHGCASGPQVRVDFDPKADFRALHAYAWAPMTVEEQQEKAKNSLTHERIKAAIDTYLTGHGYRSVAVDQADFLVTYTAAVAQRTQVRESPRVSVGYGRYGPGGGVGVGYGFPVDSTTYQYKVGTLVIDIIDARHKRLVWRGAGEQTLEEGLTPERRAEVINAAVSEILDRFPPTGKKAQ